ncbi:venom chymotrypsin inhibitor, putative [Ixodes scapularis]|uniref:Venom chymotrypsin inhibitor, putative n=1 Tax=Ixodes scapularis TaxID=6945 RepID=B7Q848_IXOSC|nr:venom chymotrypsin inhibitor, putative [Ixodes scapularis]|eukprot:XP_002404685.1 venom chymotrypsin inhibitor, putative [Ixodes scapularis]
MVKSSTVFDACLRDPCSEDAGTCMQNLLMYFHNRHNHACQEFTYTGRNFNIFVTREECHRVCVGERRNNKYSSERYD